MADVQERKARKERKAKPISATFAAFAFKTFVGTLVWLAPAPASAQAPSGGPMVVERIHSGFVIAPDVKATEIDHRVSPLLGVYGGWLADDTFLVGAGGYWLVDNHHNDREMAYGGLVVHWLVWNSGRVGLGAKGLFGGGEATLADTVTITPRVPEFRTPDGRGPTTAPALVQRIRVRDGFLLAEPEAQLSLKLMKQLRLAIGAGYRFTGTDRRSFGGDRLNGATGSLALQIGGGS